MPKPQVGGPGPEALGTSAVAFSAASMERLAFSVAFMYAD